MSSHQQNLSSFLATQQNKPVIAVQGLGFVGAVMSLVVANSDTDYAVVGIDLPKNKDVIDGLNQGKFPIESSDPKVYEYFQKAREKGNFYATSDISVYAHADVVIVDINLDVQKGEPDTAKGNDYSVNLNGFKAAMKSIAERCKPDVLLLVETTVPPGTCQKIVKPIFEEEFDKRNLTHTFKIGHSYERVMPGPGYVDSIKNFYRVFAGINNESAEAVEAFLKTIISTEQYPLTRLGNTNATEMAKVLENSFRAMNIAFIQEWTEFAEVAGVDLYEVVSAIRMRPTHKNIMRPGLGVGGYCLTKDPLLASWASQYLFDAHKLPQSEQAVAINDRMPLHSIKVLEQEVENLAEKSILFLGISYLQNVGDTRYTPVQPVYQHLMQKGVSVTLHDPYVPFWEEEEVETADLQKVLNGKWDILFLGTPHDKYLKEGLLEQILAQTDTMLVLDSHGAIPDHLRRAFYHHSYKVIGRGDV